MRLSGEPSLPAFRIYLFIKFITMGNGFHQLRRGFLEFKQSVRLSEVFSTVKQRQGDRLVKLFILSTILSMGIVTL
jgi:hypothetical protein